MVESLLSKGVASASAMANIPALDQDKEFAVGVGAGLFNGYMAVALGGTYRFSPIGQIKGSVAAGTGGKPVFGFGAGWSW